VVLYAEPEAARDAGDGFLQLSVIEGHQPSAHLAEKVVMVVLAARERTLKPCEPRSDSDPLNQGVLGQQLQHAVDGRPPDAPAVRPQDVLDLDRAERA